MDLETCTDDELVKEVERRLQLGTFGYHGMYSTNQQDFREMWRDAMDRVHDLCNGDFDRWNEVRQLMFAVQDKYGGNQIATRRRIFALNTTRLGQDDDYEQ